MNAVGVPVSNGYIHGQPKADDSVGQTKHWTQSRMVRAVAGVAVLGIGALAGLAASFFASPFAAIIAAGAVTAVIGITVIRYFDSHSGNPGIAMTSISPADQTPLPLSPATIQTPPAMSVQPPPYWPLQSPVYTLFQPRPYLPVINPYILEPHTQPAYQTPPKYSPVPSANGQGENVITCNEYICMKEGQAAKVLQSHGYRFYQSSRDGNCYFDSTVNQCSAKSGWTVQNLRNRVYQEAVQWCNNYAAHYNPGIHSFENDLYTRLMFQNGLKDLGTDKQWVDASDSVFTARVLNTPVVVINMDGTVGFAVDAQGQFMDDLLNTTRRLDHYRNILDGQFILLIFDRNHFMGVHPVKKL